MRISAFAEPLVPRVSFSIHSRRRPKALDVLIASLDAKDPALAGVPLYRWRFL
jgi:hypothetical protein